MVTRSSSTISHGDIIRSPRFAYGVKAGNRVDYAMTDATSADNRYDASRGQAEMLVTKVEGESAGPCIVYCARLNEYDRYGGFDPYYRFVMGPAENEGQIAEVELVGKTVDQWSIRPGQIVSSRSLKIKADRCLVLSTNISPIDVWVSVVPVRPDGSYNFGEAFQVHVGGPLAPTRCLRLLGMATNQTLSSAPLDLAQLPKLASNPCSR